MQLYISQLWEKKALDKLLTFLQKELTITEKLAQKGIKTLNKNFYNEFTIEVKDAEKFLSNLKSKGIIGGLKVDTDKVLVATTEMNSEEDIDKYIESI